jgi:hypothetical protein
MAGDGDALLVAPARLGRDCAAGAGKENHLCHLWSRVGGKTYVGAHSIELSGFDKTFHKTSLLTETTLF